MSNPAPTLNQINAFNATQGTTIDFNIIGGTEVIRSNKIYIYDLSDNSLICTHLYVSTESIHELPPNTSSSIVYESGKSSADFTNNTQYYAQIQTFTDVGGTQGASGLSIAKLFWCLPTPTLTLSTIPTTISTTSYNVSATYTPNISGSATNEIQEFQFNLYSAIGALLQTSGVVLYGESVDLSYNFSGLEVDSTYYVTLDVTTTQGMNVSAQSNTFTVSIDTPTIGSASVVNNGCDGYISVTSNLSSEYEHEESAGSGEIISFTTDSVDDITELDVDFSPVQDGTPWMSAQNTEPYTFRVVPTQTEDFGHESDTIVGGTVGWNQLAKNGDFSNGTSGWTSTNATITVSNNVCSFVVSSYNGFLNKSDLSAIDGHKYITVADIKVSSGVIKMDCAWASKNTTQIGVFETVAVIWKSSYTGNSLSYPRFYDTRTSNWDDVYVKNVHVHDLTAYFGTTIAEYVYGIEQITAGAGVAWLKENAPQLFKYNAYDAGSLVSVSGLTSHDMVGFNQFDKSTSTAGKRFGSSGMVLVDRATGSVSDYIRVLPNIVYYAKNVSGSAQGNTIVFYDADKSWIGTVDIGTYTSESGTFTTPNNCAYIRFQYETVNENTVCINLSDASLNGTYKPYTKHSYPLDSTLTLRGVPKLDNGKLKYDGDIYHADGSVDRRYGIVDLGTLTWTYYASETVFYCSINDMHRANGNLICDKYTKITQGVGFLNNMEFSYQSGAIQTLWFKNIAYTDATAFKTAMSGVYLVYEKTTPTTETADPFTNPQIVDPSGTEGYVGSPIPVGHKTTYQRICPITGWTGCEVDVSGVNVWDEEWELGGIDASTGLPYADNNLIRSKNFSPIVGNSDYCFVTNGNTFVVHWYDSNENQISYNQRFTPTTPSILTAPQNAKYLKIRMGSAYGTTYKNDVSVNYPSTDTSYHAYNGTTYPVSWQDDAGTVYGGTVALVTGVLTVTNGYVDLGTLTYDYASGVFISYVSVVDLHTKERGGYALSSIYQQSPSASASSMADYSVQITGGLGDSNFWIKDSRFTSASDFKTAMNGVQLVYELATPIEISLTPQQMQTLSGQNNIWSNTNGGMFLVYQLPITSLLVKRRDVADVSGKWLILYSTPITQASDMDFTFIDFLNQYGKTYQYALVPVLAQDQSGVIVQIEGGYTVSDNVDSIFDGVYIADQTNVERVKAGVGYGNIDMNQGVGSITPIGSKYPIVITNSQNQYHNGSVRGTIVPNDFYSNGNLSRIDMVNKRDELEQFLTNKHAKIIKDWNGKMWLVMIMSNVSCSFDDNYGMGMVSFSADWLEVGDPTNQQDLYNAGLINVGGV